VYRRSLLGTEVGGVCTGRDKIDRKRGGVVWLQTKMIFTKIGCKKVT
jgi:hypothetical protein